MTIYDHFAEQTKLPVLIAQVKDFILGKGVIDEIIRYPVDIDPAKLHGGYHLFRGISPPYASDPPLIARIGYPKSASEPLQRLVTVKEMLHTMDPSRATSPTMDDVNRLICDLLVKEAEQEIGMAAAVDHNGLLNALRVLMPRAALDIIRPAYKAGAKTVVQIASEAQLPQSYVAATLTDEWRSLIERRLR
jgi:hypothetical protein